VVATPLRDVEADHEPEAKRLAKIAEGEELAKPVKKYYGKAAKKQLLAEDVSAIAGLGITVTTATGINELKAAVQDAAERRVDGGLVDLGKYRPLAMRSLQDELDKTELEALRKIALASLKSSLGTAFTAELDVVTTGGYSGTGPVIPNWSSIPATGQVKAITDLANTPTKIPFFSADSAVYLAQALRRHQVHRGQGGERRPEAQRLSRQRQQDGRPPGSHRAHLQPDRRRNVLLLLPHDPGRSPVEARQGDAGDLGH
jgi:hypothetical protein